jgi:hypothetical protein
VGREQEIEDRVVANLRWFGYPAASWIRRAKMGREGVGSVDLLLLPKYGPHRLVLVEVKHHNSDDTPGRLIGQLLAYYLAALRLGSDGLECLERFSQTERAHDTRPKSLQMLSGLGRGCKPRDQEALRAGAKLEPTEIGLLVVWGREGDEEERRESFVDLRAWLYDKAGLDIKVALARSDGSFEWTASKWRRGSVDRASDHFELRHGSPSRRLIALLGHGLPGELVVEFLVGADDGVQSAAVADVRRELDFYLVEKKERDPWAYAQYHCTTAANIYSEVHWSFVAAGQSGPAGGEGLAQ